MSDTTACNFNALATDSDGLCIYTIDTCDTCGGNPLDGTGVVVNNDADGDGICDADEVAGCQMLQHVTIMHQQRMMILHVFSQLMFVIHVQVRQMVQVL